MMLGVLIVSIEYSTVRKEIRPLLADFLLIFSAIYLKLKTRETIQTLAEYSGVSKPDEVSFSHVPSDLLTCEWRLKKGGNQQFPLATGVVLFLQQMRNHMPHQFFGCSLFIINNHTQTHIFFLSVCGEAIKRIFCSFCFVF